MLVRARDEAGHSLSDEQLLAHVNILLVAGHETTTTLGAWVLYLLARAAGVCRAHRRRAAVRCSAIGRSPASRCTRLPVLSAAIRESGPPAVAGAAAAARRAVRLRVRRLLGHRPARRCFWRSRPGIACRPSSPIPSASIRIASCRRARRTASTPVRAGHLRRRPAHLPGHQLRPGRGHGADRAHAAALQVEPRLGGADPRVWRALAALPDGIPVQVTAR